MPISYASLKRAIRPFRKTGRTLWQAPMPETPDKTTSLVFVHIGKSGGESLWQAINDSEIVRSRFDHLERVHVRQPRILKNAQYLIVVRNPISRTVSAFNWRYRLVVEDSAKRLHVPGEYEILVKYGTLNALAEALFSNDTLDQHVASDFRKIHHLREDISFYLADLLSNISAEQIFGVMTTEHLNSCIADVLGVQDIKKTHENKSATKPKNLELSDTATRNLRRFLDPDYVVLDRLLRLKPIPENQRNALLK